MSSLWFSRWKKHHARSARSAAHPRARLQVEALEERTVLSTYSVVPGVGNGMTTFGTLSDLLNNANIQQGDIIQIEPASNPGHILDSDIPNVTNLTIQGDPGADLSSIPSFYLDDHVTIGTSRQGFNFNHVQFDITNGTLQLLANSNITDCHVKVDFAGEAIEVDGPTAAVISDSYLESANPNSHGTNLLRVYAPANSHNRITDNQFVALTGTNIKLIDYTSSGAGSDLIAHNTFNGNTGDSPLLEVHPSQGLTIQGNTFTVGDPLGTGIEVVPYVQNLQIVDNVISFPTGNSMSEGMVVPDSTSTVDSSMVIADNHISTNGNGLGIVLNGPVPFVNLDVKVQDNDLHGNVTGVFLAGGHGGSLAGIDLGGGSQGSLGANNFRGNNTAISVTALQGAGPIQAQMNIFGVTDPMNVIFDNHVNSILAAVVATNPLTGNAAYVETLYLDFLHRAGDLNPSVNDAAGYVADLNLGTPAATVANAIARSAEGLGALVNGLYHRFLGRDTDAGGLAGFVSYLQAGGTLEGVSEAILASPEYQSHFQTDTDFVQSHYQNLLQRTAGTAEVSAWLAAMPQLGRAGVAQQLLWSQEFRDWEVGDDYAWLLHRAPSTAEVSAWVGSGLDLLTIDTAFAGSPEFQLTG
jgi:hypothetical protein